MAHLIDKDALVAEIKERIKTYNKGYTNGDDRRADALEVLLRDIDTLEVKEVDLEKSLTGFMGRYAYENSGEYPSAIDIAKHFYELGLAQKGE